MDRIVIKQRGWYERFAERLGEPLHLNLMSMFVALFGSYQMKVWFDLIRRRHYAFGVLRAAEQARSGGYRAVTVVEFGVAGGAGLLNLAEIARNVARVTGVKVDVFGFDSGKGMPQPIDYRDHPDFYQAGDFPTDFERLKRQLPSNARLILGDLRDTVEDFTRTLSQESPFGFAIIDVDYYSSAKEALLSLADADPTKYLPLAVLYFDDITEDSQNSWCGELLAIREFNQSQPMRKIEQYRFLRSTRLFKTPHWIDQIYLLHVLDHPVMQSAGQKRDPKIYEAPAWLERNIDGSMQEN